MPEENTTVQQEVADEAAEVANHTHQPEATPDDAEVLVISKNLITNVAVAAVFLVLGFVLGGLFGTGVLVNNSDAVASALVENAPALAAAGTSGQAQAQPTATPPPAFIEDVNEDDDPTLGPDDAPVTIVEFSDFRCGFCGRYHQQTLPLIKENYGDQVRFVYRDFISVGGIQQAQAAECADDQDAFWPYHDALFADQQAYNTNEALIGLAETLDLDVDSFTTCLESERYRNEVIADMQDGREYGVTGTPAFFINGRRVSGAQPYAVFEQVIEEALAEAGASN